MSNESKAIKKTIAIGRDELFDLLTGYLLIEPEEENETIVAVRIDGETVTFTIKSK